jgi:hypothetical protein
MIPYASKDFALSIYGLAQQTSTPTNYDPLKILRNLRTASRRVDKLFRSSRPVFAPWIETRKLAIDGHYINSNLGTFNFPGYLLALNGTVSINGTSITDIEAYPDSAMPPFSQLRLTDECADWYTQVCACCTPLQVSIPGIWGFHSDYAHAWLDVDTLAAAITTTTATTFTVADVDGADAYGNTPRISAGQLVKIDSEFMEVISTNTTTNVVTVIRGAHGSTAATHLIAAAVSVWQVEEPVQMAVARQSGLMYARFGAYTVTEVRDLTEIRYPSDWLAEVYGALNLYANR